jgi:hypothetical protein
LQHNRTSVRQTSGGIRKSLQLQEKQHTNVNLTPFIVRVTLSISLATSFFVGAYDFFSNFSPVCLRSSLDIVYWSVRNTFHFNSRFSQ